MSIAALECSASPTCHRFRARDSRYCAQCGGPQEAERLRKIREASARFTYNPDDSRVDYDDTEFRAVAPQDWSRRHG